MKKKLIRGIAALIILLISLWALANLMSSFQNADRDEDGLQDELEYEIGTDALSTDTDRDGIDDKQEYKYWIERSIEENDNKYAPDGDFDFDKIPNIIDHDSDNDGVSDGQEIENGSDPAEDDTDDDGLSDKIEFYIATNPLNPDSDGDGIRDGEDSTPGGTQRSDGLTYEGSDPSQMTRDMQDVGRYGYGSDTICYNVFEPPLTSLKRYITSNAITENYEFYIADSNLIPFELSETEYDNRFECTITLNRVADDIIAIPSVAPNANIISYSSDPELQFDFFKDGADNYYVKSPSSYDGEVTFTYTTSADESYYTFHVPEHLTLDDIPEEIKYIPPSPVLAKATLVLDELGLTGETNLKTIVNTLKDYFSSFSAGEIPSKEEEPDLYLAIARSKHGKCDIRSFAFFVTANSMGLPTRFVSNECHAFVEIYIPNNGWMQLDLGGLGGYSIGDYNGGGDGPGDGWDSGDGEDEVDPSEPSPWPNEGENNLPDPDLISTTTEITYVTVSAFKDGHFSADGHVKDASKTGVSNMPVEIYLTPEKSIQGLYAGEGITDENGLFSINCKVPRGAIAGENHVIAWARRIEMYESSWSDPIIEIYSNTTLSLTMVDSIGLWDELTITGLLMDSYSLPISGKTISIYRDDTYIGETITNPAGWFSFSYIIDVLESFTVNAFFIGDEYFYPSNDSHYITIKDTSTNLELTVTPNTTERGDQLTFQGELSSIYNPLSNALLHISYNGEQIISTTTTSQGEFEEIFQIPEDATLGNITIRTHYPGTESYAEANAVQNVLVQSETQLILTSPIEEIIKQNATLHITGVITDDLEQPITNIPIFINWKKIVNSNIHIGNPSTNSNGTFNLSYQIPPDAPLGVSAIDANFAGDDRYLASHNSLEFEIVAKDSQDVGSGSDLTNDESQNNYIQIAIAAGAVAAFLVVIILLFKKQKVEEGPTLEEIALETIDKLKYEKDFRKTVINCYKQMCEWMGDKGVKKDTYQTPREFAMVSKGHLKMSSENLYTLTQIFEKARYSTHKISSNDKEKAIKCLSEIISSPVENPTETKEAESLGEGKNQ